MNPTPNQKNIVNAPITAGGNVHIGDYLVTYYNYFAAQEVKIPHRLTNNIPTNADHILGRATELAQAKDHLAQYQATVLFNGIGGIGKTALASKYMAIYGSEYKHLAWITVQSTLAEAFTNNAPLLASLQITQQVQDYIAAKQLDKAFEFLFHQLNLLERTLVVIDNANDLDDLDQYKNWFDTANCHFLITSRSQPSEWATVEVDSLPEDEAVALFRKLHPAPDPRGENVSGQYSPLGSGVTDDMIKNLLSKLFYHTLLIELVAKAGASTGIPFADLQKMIETQFIHHQSLNEVPLPTGKHGSVVATNLKKAKIEDYIWLIFSQVKGLDAESKHLLKAMALLPVATPFDLDFLKGHFAFFSIPNAVAQLDSLIERGWLQKEQAEGQKPYFKMHPLIGDVVVEQLNPNIRFANKYINNIAESLNYENTNPNEDILFKKKFDILGDRLITLFSEKYSESISKLLLSACWFNKYLGIYPKAIKYGEKALEVSEKLPKKNEKLVAECLNDLALTHKDLGNYLKASNLMEKALKLDEINRNNLSLSLRQYNLALIYRELGSFIEATNLFEKALKKSIEIDGEEHPRTSLYKVKLAISYLDLKRYSEASALAKESLDSAIKIFGENHLTIANRQAEVAVIYVNTGNFKDAITLLEKSMLITSRHLGNYHPNIATFKYWLAFSYNELGEGEKAQSLWMESYQIRLKILGEIHPHTQKVKSMLNK